MEIKTQSAICHLIFLVALFILKFTLVIDGGFLVLLVFADQIVHVALGLHNGESQAQVYKVTSLPQ